ncbi:MAG: hypothetical protein HYT79_11365 [Elusimicrobia bacterium]|nr:hypothetical protein [Elusimicrobiota bacterium]
MKKKKEKNPPRQALNLKAFQEILERTTESLENRLVGRLKAELATKEELKEAKEELKAELAKRPSTEEVRRIVNTELNKVWTVEEAKHEEHKERLQKLEVTVFPST